MKLISIERELDEEKTNRAVFSNFLGGGASLKLQILTKQSLNGVPKMKLISMGRESRGEKISLVFFPNL